MKQLKTILSFSFALIFLLSSCKKEDNQELKDFNYFKNIMSVDKNLLKINSTFNELTDLSSISNGITIQSNDFSTVLLNHYSDEKIEKRAKEIVSYYKKFIQENPDFNRLSKSEKIELLIISIKGLKNFDQSTFSIKSDVSGDCMAGFDFAANSCADGLAYDVAFAVMDDPAHWIPNLLQAEIGYRGCLNDAADAMLVCHFGGTGHTGYY